MITSITDMIQSWNLVDDIKNTKCMTGQENGIKISLLQNPTQCTCQDLPYISRNLWVYKWARCSTTFTSTQTVPSNIDPYNLVCVVNECPTSCQCFSQPSTESFIVNCEDKALSDLPFNISLPLSMGTLVSLPRYYKLLLRGNNITDVVPRYYFNQTSLLNVSGCSLRHVEDEAWIALSQISNELDLANNLLETISPVVQNLTFNSSYIHLYGNPLVCDCENGQWMKRWMNSISSKLVNPTLIQCAQPERLKGKSMLQLTDEEFCPKKDYTVLISIMTTCLGFALILTLLYFLRHK